MHTHTYTLCIGHDRGHCSFHVHCMNIFRRRPDSNYAPPSMDTFFSIFTYGIQIQVHFQLGHFLAKGNQQLLDPLQQTDILCITQLQLLCYLF